MAVRHWVIIAGLVVLAGGGGYVFWLERSKSEVPEGLAKTNGRIEAERVNVSTKFAGRVREITVKEGDTVEAGQVVARLDTEELEAQLAEAKASVQSARQRLEQAKADIRSRQSDLDFAEKELERALKLFEKGHVSEERVEQRRTSRDSADAALAAARAKKAEVEASINAAQARVRRLEADLADYTLEAPRGGRVQYRLAEPGEVLAAGGRVVTILDLTNVYMTVFLPTADAGRLAIGSSARLILDAAPQYVVPAKVTFVASDAQFTPRHVETREERAKLMFRVKLRIPRDVLQKYADIVKTGLPGVAYVRVSRQAQWPQELEVNLP